MHKKAEEGKEEREKTIDPVIKEIKSYYDYENKALMDKGVDVLVIGARFGRVVYELAKLGYNIEANEKSYFYPNICLKTFPRPFHEIGIYLNVLLEQTF